MSKFLTILFSLGFVSVAVPLASADETDADCEPGQQWIGYLSSDAARAFLQGVYGSTLGANFLTPCEGEHWDGQDAVQPGQNPGTGAGCVYPQVAQANGGFFVGGCMAPDPNTAGADPLAGNAKPVTFRVSFSQRGATTNELFIAVDIALVGRAATYVGECKGGSGLEGDATCNGNGQQRAGVYLRDNTPGNVLATVVSAAGLTRGHPSEGDCNQTTYAQGANSGDRNLCGRDNTAITVETLLP